MELDTPDRIVEEYVRLEELSEFMEPSRSMAFRFLRSPTVSVAPDPVNAASYAKNIGDYDSVIYCRYFGHWVNWLCGKAEKKWRTPLWLNLIWIDSVAQPRRRAECTSDTKIRPWWGQKYYGRDLSTNPGWYVDNL